MGARRRFPEKSNYFATILSWLEPVLSGHAITFSALIWMLHATTAAQLLHGTYFLAGVSNDYVIVAIDSRESSIGTAGRIINDRYCKIRTLSSRAIFFATGTTSAISSTTGATIFDARDIAQHTFEDFTGDNFEDLANRWATQMKAVYLSYVDAFSFVPNNEIVAEGFFVGLNRRDEISGSDATIFRRSDLFAAFAFRSERIVPGPSGNMPLLNNGHFEILEEFYGRRPSDRAKEIIARTAGWNAGPDGDAAKYAAYVGAVRDWSGDSGIGGEIATIILERGKGLRWFHRPDFCASKAQ